MSRLRPPSEPPSVVLRTLEGCRDLLPLHAARPDRYPHLLQSAAQGTAHARYDILFAFPGSTLALHADGNLRGGGGGAGDFLSAFDAEWREMRAPSADGIPFQGGWFLYLGYELAGQIEPILRLPVAAGTLPTAFATRIPAAIIVDHEQQSTTLMVEAGHEAKLELLAADLRGTGSVRASASGQPLEIREEEPERFLDAVERIKQYIRAGDVFQVNLSRRWHGRLAGDATAAALYDQLRRQNPAPFAGLATYENQAIVSSSPERLVRVRGDRIETRPIAGTRPRGVGHARDSLFREELIAHPKERAEHVMLIDLERNDLGRVCRPGTVEVDELMSVESYAHVHHIVSNVRGLLRSDTSPGEAIRAVFPGGTITGCPKVRCMAIIAELEGVPRGPYTGAMGYVNRDGGLDLNILIRTLVLNGNAIEFRAGAGIVADSEPLRELEETRAKARGLLLALRQTSEQRP